MTAGVAWRSGAWGADGDGGGATGSSRMALSGGGCWGKEGAGTDREVSGRLVGSRGMGSVGMAEVVGMGRCADGPTLSIGTSRVSWGSSPYIGVCCSEG